MTKLDLTKYGITDVKEVLHNPSYEVLYQAETEEGLNGYEKGQLTELGAVNVMTGIYTGRSPKDKFFVKNEASENTVWWTSDEYKNDNKPCSEAAWADLKAKAVKQLSGKKLYVVDTFCGANEGTRLKVRFIMEVAWQAHFVKNMFIRPTDEELANYGEPDFVSFNAAKAKVDNYKELGLNSETATVFNLKTKEQVILNTWYGGEMKKGIFSIMNYLNPLRGIASMHCSANTDLEGKTPPFSSDCPVRAKPPFPPTPNASSSVTTSTAGTMKESSTTKADATPRSSTSTKRASRTSTTPSSAMPSWRT